MHRKREKDTGTRGLVDLAVEPKTGAYSVSVAGSTWFESAATTVSDDGKVYSSAAGGGLTLASSANGSGSDARGSFTSTNLTWTTGSGNTFMTGFRAYDNAVVFTQLWPQGANNTATGTRDDVLSSFPAFGVTGEEGVKGYASLSGSMIADFHVGSWNDDTGGIAGGLAGGPVAVFDSNMTTVVLSPASQFMASSFKHTKPASKHGGGVLGAGVLGSVTSLPAGFSTSFVLHAGAGFNAAWQGWGTALRAGFGKTDALLDTDETLTKLGYSTDNGAYYYYHAEGDKAGKWGNGKYSDMEATMAALKNYSDSAGIPYRYWLADSWWYPKDYAHGNGVLTWTAVPDVFPHGLAAVHQATGWGVQGHNRFWSRRTPYARQNGGDYSFEIGARDNMAMPLEQRFWDDLLANATRWGLVNYEQDWLHNELEGVTRATTDVALARTWLLQMGAGAEKNGLTVQYCMAYPRHVLQSVEIPAVSHFRASGDYHGDSALNQGSQWHVGHSSIVAHALALGPAAVTHFTRGPVAPSDRVGLSDAALIRQHADAAGTLLRASRPATAIDATFAFRAKIAGATGPDGEVWSSTSSFGPSGCRKGGASGECLTFDHVFAADLRADFDVAPADLHRRPAPGSAVQFAHPAPGEVLARGNITDFGANAPIKLAKCGRADFQLVHTAPVLSNGWVLVGELAKWVPASPDRVTSIDAQASSLVVGLKGAQGEAVKLTFLDASSKLVAATCVLPPSGRATLTMPAGSCK
eukprot:g6546.t1